MSNINDFHHFYNQEARIVKEGAGKSWRGGEGEEGGVLNEDLCRVLLHLSDLGDG